MNNEEKIAVLRAHGKGKQIEFRVKRSNHRWANCLDPVWNFAEYEYREKPMQRPPIFGLRINNGSLLLPYFSEDEAQKTSVMWPGSTIEKYNFDENYQS